MEKNLTDNEIENIKKLLNVYTSIDLLYNELIKINKKLDSASLIEKESLKKEKEKIIELIKMSREVEDDIFNKLDIDNSTFTNINNYLISKIIPNPDDYIEDEFVGLYKNNYSNKEARRIIIGAEKRKYLSLDNVNDEIKKIIQNPWIDLISTVSEKELEESNIINKVLLTLYEDVVNILIARIDIYIKHYNSAKDIKPYENLVIDKKVIERLEKAKYDFMFIYSSVEKRYLNKNFDDFNNIEIKYTKTIEKLNADPVVCESEVINNLIIALTIYIDELLSIKNSDLLQDENKIELLVLKFTIISILYLLSEKMELKDIWETVNDKLKLEKNIDIYDIFTITKNEIVDCFKRFNYNTKKLKVKEKEKEKTKDLAKIIKFN